MRWHDLSGGSIKAFVILALIAANLAAAFLPGSARVSRAGDGVLAIANFSRDPASGRKFAASKTPQTTTRDPAIHSLTTR